QAAAPAPAADSVKPKTTPNAAPKAAERATDIAAENAKPVAASKTDPPPGKANADVAGGTEDTELVRRRWPEVLGTLEHRRVTWALVSQSAQVGAIDAGVLTLAFD